MLRFIYLYLALLIFLPAGSLILPATSAYSLEGENTKLSHIELQLVSEVNFYNSNEPFWVAIRAKPQESWHFYWEYPGDSGAGPKIDWSSTFGAEVHGPEFPVPKRIPIGPLVNFGYDTETYFLFKIVPLINNNAAIELRVDAEFLVCKEECIPENTVLSLTIPSKNISKDKSSIWKDKIEETKKSLAFDYPSIDVQAFYDDGNIKLIGNLPDFIKETSLDFFPLTPRIIQNAALPQLTINENKFELLIKKHKNFQLKELKGILVSSKGWTPDNPKVQAIKVSSEIKDYKTQQVTTSSSFIYILVIAFLGGLILNLMPCVFPILTLKALSILEKGNKNKTQLIIESSLFTLGVISTFLALAAFILIARSSGEAVGWGFQLQSPGFVAFLSMLTFILALNFLGVFDFGASLQQISSRFNVNKHGQLKSFFDGILMTALATPCTAPFMGSALAYGLSAPTTKLLLVFCSLALGVAFPFVLLSHSNKLRLILPRPGLWMERLKQLLAFPLFATSIWLLWVLGLQSSTDRISFQLLLFLIVAFVLWFYKEFANLSAPALRRRILGVLCLATITCSLYFSSSMAISSHNEAEISWEPYSADRLSELREENRIIYVDFTASWCITCQVNKLVAFSSADVKSRIKDLNVAMLKADWTNRDPEITKALNSFEREGVPLNVIYPRDTNRKAIILPQVLTPGIVLSYLEEASK